MVFLQAMASAWRALMRIYMTYGVDAVQVMTENPYRARIRGIGFKTAEDRHETRHRKDGHAGFDALTEAMDDGHCGLPAAELAPLAVELLEVPKELVQTALDTNWPSPTVVADTVATP